MSNIDKKALREAANAANGASWGNWESYKPHKGARGYEVKVGVKAVAQHCLKVDSVFIAAANPATVLALLDELEAKDKQISLDFQIKARLCRESNSLHDRLREAEKRIAELEATEAVVNIKSPTIGRAYSVLNHVWTEQEVRKACELAGIKLNIAAAGKGE
ncbi:ead/Ea22-like family protein [Enterobacter hormaechei]|nr:ead/Ea22-like family protein [Enterobacter hormaechei]ELT0864271.1 ead/Ea22-like family protein [Enterobacter hormaechei]EMD5675330.1 ead/Ea22-like family protein [Enterobacter hormaechei]EMD6793539.1 ead/Ea22-like family protein [Enterobacter hormaechei subsp. steigerwaltii]EMF2144062.1 ead/Ea22-like family protein [Enterobacter hormaechei]